jgi:hypothetical protein
VLGLLIEGLALAIAGLGDNEGLAFVAVELGLGEGEGQGLGLACVMRGLRSTGDGLALATIGLALGNGAETGALMAAAEVAPNVNQPLLAVHVEGPGWVAGSVLGTAPTTGLSFGDGAGLVLSIGAGLNFAGDAAAFSACFDAAIAAAAFATGWDAATAGTPAAARRERELSALQGKHAGRP